MCRISKIKSELDTYDCPEGKDCIYMFGLDSLIFKIIKELIGDDFEKDGDDKLIYKKGNRKLIVYEL